MPGLTNPLKPYSILCIAPDGATTIMKAKIHPKYNPTAEVTCVCGNKTTVGSTKDKFDVDVCSNCHPFYTGKAKVMDTAGRVEKFKARATAKVAPVTKVRVAKNKKAE